MKLVKLKASSVRGIAKGWPDLPIGDRGLIVLGSNGVGKSSIIDAIEFSLTGKSSLFAETRSGVNWSKASPHIRHGDPVLSIVIKEDSAAFEINVSSLPLPDELPVQFREWLKIAEKSSFVLRRHMLLAFICKQPRERYDLLEPFLNLSEFSRLENALKDLCDKGKSNLDLVDSRIQANENKIRTLFGLTRSVKLNEDVLFSALNESLKNVGLKSCEKLEDIQSLLTEVSNLLGGKEKTDRLADLGSLKKSVQGLEIPNSLNPLLQGLLSSLEQFEQQVVTKTSEITTEFLIAGQKILSDTSPSDCPLCEQKIDLDSLKKRLKQRIEDDAQLTSAKKLVTTRRNNLKSPSTTAHTAIKALISDWKKVVGTDIPQAYKELEELFSSLSETISHSSLKSSDISHFPDLLDAAISDHSALITLVDDLLAKEGGGERRKHLTDAKSMLDALSDTWAQYKTDLERKSRSSEKLDHVKSIYDSAVTSRKKTVQGILEAVASTANELYEFIHPEEQIASSKLSVRAATSKSVEMDSTFHGVEAHPLLYFSESHLDTLGLCYFLALRQHEVSLTPSFQVLILDDVLHSVDSDHRNRIAKLLKNYFDGSQLIITTHDPHFYEMLRHQLGNNGYNFVKIVDWNVTSGPVLASPLTDLDKIVLEEERQRLSSEDLSATAGRFFEWLLRELTENLQIALQARFKRGHDIGSMWPATGSKLEKQKGFQSQFPDLVKDIDSNSWVRNACGAHYNPTPCPATPSEVQEFGRLLAELYKSTWCSDCRNWISVQRDKGWRCACSRLQYSSKQLSDDSDNYESLLTANEK